MRLVEAQRQVAFANSEQMELGQFIRSEAVKNFTTFQMLAERFLKTAEQQQKLLAAPPPPPPDLVPLGIAAVQTLGRVMMAFGGRLPARKRRRSLDPVQGSRAEPMPAARNADQPSPAAQDAARAGGPQEPTPPGPDTIRRVMEAMVGGGSDEELMRIMVEEGISPAGLKAMLNRINQALGNVP